MTTGHGVVLDHVMPTALHPDTGTDRQLQRLAGRENRGCRGIRVRVVDQLIPVHVRPLLDVWRTRADGPKYDARCVVGESRRPDDEASRVVTYQSDEVVLCIDVLDTDVAA